MSTNKIKQEKTITTDEKNLCEKLKTLKLTTVLQCYNETAERAAANQWSYPHYLLELCENEVNFRNDKSTQRRIAAARFPSIKTLDGFDWNWPKKINRPQVQNLFRLAFVEQKANVIFLGGVGLGKTHLSSALA